MKPLNLPRILLLAGSLLLAGMLPVAASPLTDAFVARVRPAVDMLDRSSRLALDISHNASVRRFAHREAIEQTIAANSLVAWSQTNTLAGAEVALGTPLPAAAPAPLAAPVPAIADVTANAVLTGRSVAIDRPLTVTRAPRTGSGDGEANSAPTDEDALARLSSLKGAAFDASYRDMQHDGLRRLADVYADYKRSGDDPALRALATRELPKINQKLGELGRL